MPPPLLLYPYPAFVRLPHPLVGKRFAQRLLFERPAQLPRLFLSARKNAHFSGSYYPEEARRGRGAANFKLRYPFVLSDSSVQIHIRKGNSRKKKADVPKQYVLWTRCLFKGRYRLLNSSS